MVISKEDFLSYLYKLSQENKIQVIIPELNNINNNNERTFYFSLLKENSKPELNSYRTVDPTKILFYLFREKVLPVAQQFPQRIVLGIKECDLKSIKLLDIALTGSGFIDPVYKAWRDNTLIISSDCYDIHQTCSCNLVDGLPYPTEGFDINISSINGSLILQVGSDKGKEFLENLKKEFTIREANSNELEEITKKRNETLEKLNEKNAHLMTDKNYSEFRKVDMTLWHEESKTCIGCGACTNICPTCYCLILNDESESNSFVKVRTYDSCQWYGYARVAGGGTPRPKMTERFRHRYLCKFDYMVKNFNLLGCTGCGRCTEACAGKIDFREVVKKVSSAVIKV